MPATLLLLYHLYCAVFNLPIVFVCPYNLDYHELSTPSRV